MFAGPLTDRSPAKVIILVHSGSCGDLRGTVAYSPNDQARNGVLTGGRSAGGDEGLIGMIVRRRGSRRWAAAAAVVALVGSTLVFSAAPAAAAPGPVYGVFTLAGTGGQHTGT
jgi:hypothetical protein